MPVSAAGSWGRDTPQMNKTCRDLWATLRMQPIGKAATATSRGAD